MDVVYRYRRNGSGDELRYSLRSLINIPHDNVWVVGEDQPWLTRVRHLRRHQQSSNKWENSRGNLLAACRNDEISDDFILMDDDFFIMTPLQSIPTLHRGYIEDVIDSYARRHVTSNYSRGFPYTLELMKKMRIGAPYYCYELHVPIVINKAKLLESMDVLKGVKLECNFHIRTWYGNFAKIGGTQSRDFKFGNLSKLPNEPTFLSTSNTSFRSPNSVVRKYITRQFQEPSCYEK